MKILTATEVTSLVVVLSMTFKTVPILPLKMKSLTIILLKKLEKALDRSDISRPQKRLMRNQLFSMMDYYTALKLRVIDLLDADGVS